MKFFVDDELVFELTETQLKVLKHVLHDETLKTVINDKIKFIINNELKFCRNELSTEWIGKLKANKVKSIPLDDDEFAELVFKQKDYQSRSEREPYNPKKHIPIKE